MSLRQYDCTDFTAISVFVVCFKCVRTGSHSSLASQDFHVCLHGLESKELRRSREKATRKQSTQVS